MFLNFIVKCLKVTSAISDNKSKEIFLIIVMSSFDILMLGGMIFALFSTTEITYQTANLGIIFCGSFSTGLRLETKLYENKLRRIISGLSGQHPNFPHFVDKNITEDAEAETERKFTSRYLGLVFSLSLFLLCPYIYFVTQSNVSLEDPNLQATPYFYSFWKTPTVTQFVSKTILEMLTSSTNIISYWNYAAFVMYAVYNVQTHIRQINHLFKKAIEESTKKYMAFAELSVTGNHKCNGFIVKYANSSKWKDDYEKSIHQEFVKLVKYQQFLHSYISDVTSFLNQPYSSLFAWYISTCILFSFAFLKVEGNFLFFLKVIILLFHNNLALFVFCDAAETVHHMNEEIIDSFYNTEWYHLLPKSRKDLLFILTLSQRKYRVKCFGMYVVNLNLFIYALRNVYSALNIMVATQKK